MILLRFRREQDWGSWTQVEITDQDDRERDEEDLANILASGCIHAGIELVERWDAETQTWEGY